MRNKGIITGIGLTIFFAACQQPEPAKDTVSKLEKDKISGAVSCTATGLPVQDSALYMSGGGAEFQPTEFGDLKVPVKKDEGMVWIPGGDFSMGGVNPIGMMDGGHEGMGDARPVHRVRVDGFFMDVTEVTNKEFAAFVAATGYVTVAETKPTTQRIPECTGGKSGCRLRGVHTQNQTNDLSNSYNWWNYVHGANWRHPTGPGSDLIGKGKLSCGTYCGRRCRSLCKMGR